MKASQLGLMTVSVQTGNVEIFVVRINLWEHRRKTKIWNSVTSLPDLKDVNTKVWAGQQFRVNEKKGCAAEAHSAKLERNTVEGNVRETLQQASLIVIYFHQNRKSDDKTENGLFSRWWLVYWLKTDSHKSASFPKSNPPPSFHFIYLFL